MSENDGLPDLGVDEGAGRTFVGIIDTGINPTEYLRERGLIAPGPPVIPQNRDRGEEEDEEEEEDGVPEHPSAAAASNKRGRGDGPVPSLPEDVSVRARNVKCSLKKAQELLDLVDARADAAGTVRQMQSKVTIANVELNRIQKQMHDEALVLIPSIVASRLSTMYSDASNAVFQAITNVYRTDDNEDADSDEDSDAEAYRKSKVTIVFFGNATTHNGGYDPQQPGKKTLYLHMIGDEFVRVLFYDGEVVYSWINRGEYTPGFWEGPVLPQHVDRMTEIAVLQRPLAQFAKVVLHMMSMNYQAYMGSSDQTRIFWRDHIIPRLQAVERAQGGGGGGGGAAASAVNQEEEDEEEEEEDEAPAKKSRSGRKPKKAAPAPQKAPYHRQSTAGKKPKKDATATTAAGRGGRKKK